MTPHRTTGPDLPSVFCIFAKTELLKAPRERNTTVLVIPQPAPRDVSMWPAPGAGGMGGWVAVFHPLNQSGLVTLLFTLLLKPRGQSRISQANKAPSFPSLFFTINLKPRCWLQKSQPPKRKYPSLCPSFHGFDPHRVVRLPPPNRSFEKFTAWSGLTG